MVVLEAGLLSFSLQWAWVQPEVARFTTACAYDRPGYGWSPAAPWLPVAGRQAVALDRLLAAAGLGGPYVLVGHSYGAFVARAFAARRLESIAGMVLVDPAHPSQMDARRCDPGCIPEAVQADQRRFLWLTPLLTRLGLLRAGASAGFDELSLARTFPEHARPAIEAKLVATHHWLAGQAELDHFQQSGEDARALTSLGHRPLVVVAADSTWVKQSDGYTLPAGVDGAALDRSVFALSQDQTKLSADSRLIVVPGATHVTLATSRKDAGRVVAAIREVVERSRKQ